MEGSMDLKELLQQLKTLKETIQSQKTNLLNQKKQQLQTLIEDKKKIETEISEIIEEIKATTPTTEELQSVGYPSEIISLIIPTKTRSGRATVIYRGQPMSAKAVCDILGLQVNGDSAVRVLQRYLRDHPTEDIKIL